MDMRFAAKAFMEMNIKARMADAWTIAEKTGKTVAAILMDMLKCALRYGAGPADYCLFELYSKTPEQRATYITRGINNSLVKKYNDPAYTEKIDIKTEFSQHFAEFTGRRGLDIRELTQEDLAKFCRGKTRVLYKPADGSCGKGIEMIDLQKQSEKELYVWLKEKGEGLLDEVVDNLNSAGIAAKLELEDGQITLPAAGKSGQLYYYHPQSGAKIVGFQIPNWKLVLKTVEAASKVIPQVGYVGWDVAVRENDAVLIEGNSYPGHDILQLPAYTPDNIGLLGSIKNFI